MGLSAVPTGFRCTAIWAVAGLMRAGALHAPLIWRIIKAMETDKISDIEVAVKNAMSWDYKKCGIQTTLHQEHNYVS